MAINYNPHISVDCVVFGFNDDELKALLVYKNKADTLQNHNKYKLPGDLIHSKETLSDSAERILKEYTGLSNIFLKIFGVFDDPNRLSNTEDLEWLRERRQLPIERVVTVAYYSLVKVDESRPTELSLSYNASWISVNNLPNLMFDHRTIIEQGLETLKRELLTEPLAYELLPRKFTLNQLQKLYETILGIPIDNRNFRKRINNLGYIIPLNERQKDVAHKPAQYHMFDREKFESFKKDFNGFII